MPFLSLSPSPACPSICIPLGWREEGAGASFSILLFLREGASLVCDLVFHMIEIGLILLGINVLHWHREDSRRERKEKMKEDDRGKKGIV